MHETSRSAVGQPSPQPLYPTSEISTSALLSKPGHHLVGGRKEERS